MTTGKVTRYVFIGGLQRSGTTLVGSLLGGLNGVSGLTATPTNEDEGQFVQTVLPTDHELGRRHRRNLRGAVNSWAFNPDSHLTEVDAAQLANARERIEVDWAPYWADPSAGVRVEKSPSNLTRTRFLQATFPDSRFVVVTRHPLTQALAVRKWAQLTVRVGLNLDTVIDHWLVAMRRYREDSRLLEATREVRYEDLVRTPRATMESLADFVSVPTNGLDVSGVRDGDDVYRRYWKALLGTEGSKFKPLNPPGSVARELVRFTERMVAPRWGRFAVPRLIEKYEEQIQEFGYTFDDLMIEP